MKKIKIFEDIKIIVETPMLSNKDYSSIAQVEIYLNKYGSCVISATNHDGGTGYYSLPLDYLLENLEDDLLKYLRDGLNNELKNREEKYQ